MKTNTTGFSRLKLGASLGAWALAAGLSISTASAEAWKFGVMCDTQWIGANATDGPNGVAVRIIDQLNQQFIGHQVAFVIQVGDLTDNGTTAALDTRAARAAALYNAGIGFLPLRGNHESSKTAALQFLLDFPQTTAAGMVSPSTPTGLVGLTYSFDYNNARFVLLDQFTRTTDTSSRSANSAMLDQVDWITGQVAARPANTHAFVFSHKNLIGENHTDILFGASPSSNPSYQSSFFDSLAASGVRYVISGHDHIHQRSLVASPDFSSWLQEIICASDSSKFYIPLGNWELPGTINNDVNYDIPAFGAPRELSLAQERYTIGYYIYTVDGPRVTVDFYSAPSGAVNTFGEYLIATTPQLNFSKRETFGYSLNGLEFLVPQGQPYTSVQDSIPAGDGFVGTAAKILAGVNGSTTLDGSGRPLTKAVDTGWAPAEAGLASDVLTLWGMADLGTEPTDNYVLMMSFYKTAPRQGLGYGGFGIASRDDNGNWVNAVAMNSGGATQFVKGPWKSGYPLGTYGVDASTKTAWAVINRNGDFAVASGIEPPPGHRN